MKITSARFQASASNLAGCPNWKRPEFAVIGRSNVGKSSLVNSLAHRKDLARVSKVPGKTQLLNFYVLNESWALVDLPGYGYAKVSEHRRLDFNAAVAEFLAQRPNLRRVYVLIDVRLPPQAIDLEFLQWLEGRGTPYTLVFTKADKQSATRNAASCQSFQKALAGARPRPHILYSSETGAGRGELLASISAELDRA
jgi:GTP-binding protein